jgi:hypothetical protein
MNAELFRGTINKYKELRHIRTQEDLRKHTTVGSNKTFGKYFADPELIPLGVFNQIMDCLNVPYEERWEILKKKGEER